MATELEKREKREVEASTAEQLVSAANAYSPDVDIADSEEAMLFAVDLPGVEKGDVKIEVDENNILTIRARNSFKEPEGTAVRQYRIGDYFRAFSIGEEFDKTKISGKLENGVLLVTIPRREEAKPKRIEISA